MTSSTSRQTTTYRNWQRLGPRRLGRWAFSTALVARAPYFGTVLPTVVRMQPGYCEATAPKWFGVHNHIGTFHAIAACNLAEVTMGMLAEATVPSTHRWIPKAMQVQYLRKAETGLRAVAHLPEIPDFSEITTGQELTVPIDITDKTGQRVVHAEITIWVTPKK